MVFMLPLDKLSYPARLLASQVFTTQQINHIHVVHKIKWEDTCNVQNDTCGNSMLALSIPRRFIATTSTSGEQCKVFMYLCLGNDGL